MIFSFWLQHLPQLLVNPCQEVAALIMTPLGSVTAAVNAIPSRVSRQTCKSPSPHKQGTVKNTETMGLSWTGTDAFSCSPRRK